VFKKDLKTVGVLSEMAAQRVYLERGWDVFTPVSPQPRVDFVVVDKETGSVLKVQVKTVQDNTVNGITYRQCRLVPNKKPYEPHEIDRFIFVHPPTGDIWGAAASQVIKKTSINFGRADGKGKEPRNNIFLNKFKQQEYK